MKYLLSVFLFLYTLVSFGQHLNVRVDNPELVSSPNEPSIMINPKNPNQIMAASNLDYYYTSVDGGYTWESHQLSSASNGVWGDPCIIVDTAQAFYFMHLANPPGGNWIDRIVCQKTNDFGESWPVDTFTGLNGDKAQDKEWAVVDRSNNNIYMTWTQFDDYGSASPSDSSAIMFSKTTDGGESWSEAIRINQTPGNCIDSDSTVEGAVPAIGPEGQVYVAWSGPEGIVFDKSYDQGETWLDEDIPVDPHPTGWDYDIPGIYRANGLPVTTCDTSQSPYRGTIYINWSDQRNGEDDTDIWLAKSTDEGETWSDPVRVNNDEPGNQQFFTWMTIDQTNGNLYFVFYDRRGLEGLATNVYMAMSEDGGESFYNYKINDEPFIAYSGYFFGDYTNISAYDDVIRPIWAESNSNMEIHTAIINPLALSHSDPLAPDASIKAFPNPFNQRIIVKLENNTATDLSVKLFSMDGKEVATLMKKQSISAGEHTLEFKAPYETLSTGVYYLKLIKDKTIETKKMVFHP